MSSKIFFLKSAFVYYIFTLVLEFCDIFSNHLMEKECENENNYLISRLKVLEKAFDRLN